MSAWRWDGEDLILQVRVQARASREDITGQGGVLRVRTTAAPVGGQANERVRELLARGFGVPRSRVELLRGGSCRDKTWRIARPSRLPDCLPATAHAPPRR